MKRLAVVISVITLFVGCGVKEVDPKESFEQIVLYFSENLQDANEAYANAMSADGAEEELFIVVDPNSFKYDIRKTDSVVSPYVANLSYSYIAKNSHESPEDPFCRSVTDFDATLGFVFQDSTWVYKSMSYIVIGSTRCREEGDPQDDNDINKDGWVTTPIRNTYVKAME